jgi:hypothetical protein
MMLQELGDPGLGGNPFALGGTLAVLSAMITPAVLISACGSLAISTSNRLSRTIERARKLSEQFAVLSKPAEPGVAATVDPVVDQHRAVLFDQLERATRRAQLLQRTMTRLYLAISVFVATSVAIGIVMVVGRRFAWIPVTFGLVGAGLLFHASVLLIIESRVSLTAIQSEMDFVWRTGQALASPELVEKHRSRRRSRGFPFGRSGRSRNEPEQL